MEKSERLAPADPEENESFHEFYNYKELNRANNWNELGNDSASNETAALADTLVAAL